MNGLADVLCSVNDWIDWRDVDDDNFQDISSVRCVLETVPDVIITNSEPV